MDYHSEGALVKVEGPYANEEEEIQRTKFY
jgi:hypothetical protein